MLPNEKVIKLTETNLYDDIIAYFSELDNQYVNDPRFKKADGTLKKSSTRVTYERCIREFFMMVLGKEIEHLKIGDLINLKKRDIIEYRTKLLEKGNANQTINLKISSVRSLFKFLSAEHDINDKIFNLKSLKENSKSYTSLSQTEAERFATVAFETEREKPFVKKMLIMLAIRSSFRLDELLNLRWKDFEPILDEGICKVCTIGKGGKPNCNSFSIKLYNEILELKKINKENKEDSLVFELSKDSINDMMKRLRERLSVEDRNIVFHSFRGVAIDFALETGDIKQAAQQANHSSIETTYKHYINKSRDYTQTAGVRMDMELDYSIMDQLSVDDFKEFIKSGNYKLFTELQNFINNKRETI